MKNTEEVEIKEKIIDQRLITDLMVILIKCRKYKKVSKMAKLIYLDIEKIYKKCLLAAGDEN